MNWKWILVLILLLHLVIFAVQNYEIVKIQFLFWSFRTSRAIVIFSTLFIGIIIGWITPLIKRG
ncbi:MAG: LapA family protein [Candidatus Omnitrophota bacterium]